MASGPRGSPMGLAMPLTSFVGRERELTAVERLLTRARLVTLTGSPGSGKTRLAVEAAQRVCAQYADGVCLTELASILDAEQVAGAIAASLYVQKSPAQAIAQALRTFLQEKHLLLILDNFEHLLAAAPFVAELLATCPALSVLATSRAPLLVRGEHTFLVPPLSLPLTKRASSIEAVRQAEAVRLFVDRTRAVRHDFALTTANAAIVAEICFRLDGLPLAIELAASRTRLLAVAELLARLEHRLPLLTDGAVDLPARQRTLRTAIAWSDNLLSEQERVLFHRLAVFAGGWTLPAAEHVAGTRGNQVPATLVLDRLGVLQDHCLILQTQRPNESPRFTMLESLREYAGEQLALRDEAAMVQQRHAGFYLAAAEERAAWPEWEAQEHAAVADYARLPAMLRWFITEYANLQAALRWLTTSRQPELGLRLCLALEAFWVRRGPMSEGRAHLQALLALPAGPSAIRARSFTMAAALARHQGHFAAAAALLEQSIEVWRRLGDRYGLAVALNEFALAQREQRNYARANGLLEESLALFRALDDRHGIVCSLDRLGTVAHAARDYAQAQSWYEEALIAGRHLGNAPLLGWLQNNLGCLAVDRDDLASARTWLTAALATWKRTDERLGEVGALAALAVLAAAEGLAWQALRLAAAARALAIAMGIPALPAYPTTYERRLVAARQALGETAASAAEAAGRVMTLAEALAYAASPESPPTIAAAWPSTRSHAFGLTPREQEIASLIARGMSNHRIAESLVISERTVETHVSNILATLVLSSRTQIVAWVMAHR